MTCFLGVKASLGRAIRRFGPGTLSDMKICNSHPLRDHILASSRSAFAIRRNLEYPLGITCTVSIAVCFPPSTTADST